MLEGIEELEELDGEVPEELDKAEWLGGAGGSGAALRLEEVISLEDLEGFVDELLLELATELRWLAGCRGLEA